MTQDEYTLDTAKQIASLAVEAVFANLLPAINGEMHLENTQRSQDGPFHDKEGDYEMASKCKRRIKIGSDETGKPIFKWACGNTEDEVNDNIVRIYVEYGLIDHFLSAEKRSALPATPKQTPAQDESVPVVKFGTYAQEWMVRYKYNSLKKTTLKGYIGYLHKHLVPAFGDMNLMEITVDDIQDFLNERRDLARKTLREYLVLLRQILDSAVEDGIITFNPAKSKRILNPSDKITVREALPLEIVQQILRDIATLPDNERRLIALLLLTGMRRGEVLGLRWEDIDYEKKMIFVRRNVTYPTNDPNITTPKTENGVRQVPLDGNLITLLAKPGHAKGYIIGGRSPITFGIYRGIYERIERKVDLHGATAHIFRHSYLTLLDAAGVDPKTLQVIAGHGDIKITMNRYVHGREKEILAAGDKLSNLMNPLGSA